MFDRYALADAACAILMQEVGSRLNAILAEHRVSNPSQLPRGVVDEVIERAIVETAVARLPTANLEALRHGCKSFTHPAFFPALERMRLSTKGGSDTFDMTRGIYAAVVLAGFGLPVAPFNLATKRILGKPSSDIDAVLALFERDKSAYVGYNVCAAPFYVLLTDCSRTLRELVPVHPQLAEVRKLFARAGASLPPDPGQRFISGMAICSRKPGDTISTVGLLDPDPTAGSIMLYAGGQVGRTPWRSE